jgi:Flp pilus assembly protein CpaB
MPADLSSPTRFARRASALLSRHRRPLAAAVLTLAVVSALGSTGQDASRIVVTAARDLDSGHLVTADDVRLTPLPAHAVPAAALHTADDVVGRAVALPIRAGEPLTAQRVVGRPLLDALAAETGADVVATTVPMSDPASLAVVRAGDVVDVLASGESGSSAVTDARVLAVLAANGSVEAGAVVLAVSRADAVSLARFAATSRLSLAIGARR